jgi:hypothetical protein
MGQVKKNARNISVEKPENLNPITVAASSDLRSSRTWGPQVRIPLVALTYVYFFDVVLFRDSAMFYILMTLHLVMILGK